MGKRRIVKYEADVIDSVRSDWAISDDGDDRGPQDVWPAPFLGSDDGSNLVPRHELRRNGSRDGTAFDGGIVGRVGRVPNVFPPGRRSPFGDGGLNRVPDRRPLARDQYADIRHDEAIFSRTGIDGDAYRFLRRQDPGDDLLYAPRRGPYLVTSTSATNAGAGFVPFSDAADIYDDIATWHRQTLDFIRAAGGKITPAQNQTIYEGYRDLQLAAKGDGKYKAVELAHGRASGVVNALWRGKPPARLVSDLLVHHQNMQRALGAKTGIMGAVSAVGSVVQGVGSAIGSVATTVGHIVTSPVKLLADVATGKNILESLKDTVKRDLQSAKEIAPYAQAVLSVVPGVGSGINAAIAAGAALAQGQNITDALVAGVKGMVPGGPLAQQALMTAYNVAKGQPLTEAAAGALRSQIPAGPAQMAFDTGLALAHGQSLQQALIQHGSKLLPGGETVQSAARAVASGQNVADVVKGKAMSFVGDSLRNLSPVSTQALSGVGPRIGRIASNAIAIVPAQVKQTAQAILQRPELRSLPVSEVARRLNVTQDDARHAVASVVQAAQRTGMGQGIRSLAPAHEIAARIGTASTFDENLARFGSRVAPIAFNPNATTFVRPVYPVARFGMRRSLPRMARLMPGGAMGLHDAGALATLRVGSSGADVQKWQMILGVKADGKFGPATDAATRAWQRAHGLTPDGVVGPQTWSAATGGATSSVAVGSSAPGVVTVPEIVIAASPPPPLTQTQIAVAASQPTLRAGMAGPAVETWQGILRRDSGISNFAGPVDGKFGPATDAATRRWQGSSGLAADGVVGPATWKKGIGSLTTAPLPAESAPGVPLPTPIPPNLPPGLPPIPTSPAAPPTPIAVIPMPAPPPIFTAPPSIGITTPPPVGSPGHDAKAGTAVAVLALGGLLAKLAGIF